MDSRATRFISSLTIIIIMEKIEILEINLKVMNTFQDTINFCERWDQASFDPNYDTIPLKEFVPMVQRIFNRTLYRNL